MSADAKQIRFFAILFAAWFALFALSLNFRPPDYRPWNRLRRGPFNFKPNGRVVMKVCGDLGWIKDVKELQFPREQVFTTDPWGYRNPGVIENPRVVVSGDSYPAGGGLNDTDTLTVRMSELMGEKIYNFCGEAKFAPSEFLADPRFKAHPPQVLIYSPVYRMITPFPIEKSWRYRGKIVYLDDYTRLLISFKLRLDRDNFLAHLFKDLASRVSPKLIGGLSVYVDQVTVQGEPKLTLSLDVLRLTQTPQERQLHMVVTSLVKFDEELKKRGVRFIYAPSPEPGSIYPEFYPKAESVRLQNPPFIDLVFAELDKRGIEYIDLRKDLIANRFPYLYLPDDTHWNPRAVSIAAKTIVDYLARK